MTIESIRLKVIAALRDQRLTIEARRIPEKLNVKLTVSVSRQSLKDVNSEADSKAFLSKDSARQLNFVSQKFSDNAISDLVDSELQRIDACITRNDVSEMLKPVPGKYKKTRLRLSKGGQKLVL